jgi:hypothetical protein
MRWSRYAGVQVAVLLFPLCLLLPSIARADLIVPNGGTVSLGGSVTALGCTDIIVGGTLNLNTATVTGVRNVTIQPGGVINGGSGSIALAGNWSNTGSFVAGTSTVSFVDNAPCAPSSTITGSTTFFNLSLVSSTGKVYAFQAGATTTVNGLLTILGIAGTSIKIVSTAPGSPANLFLAPGGSQNILHVGVTDNDATGQFLAPGQANEGGGADVIDWFGAAATLGGELTQVPTLGEMSLLLLILMLGAIGMSGVARLRPESNSQVRSRK